MKTLFDWMNEGYTVFSDHMEKHGVDMKKENSMQNTLAVVCQDGFTVSIQASASHYCSPRKSFNRLENYSDFTSPIVDYSIYNEMELGYPSARDDLLTDYAETPDGDIYGWVPVDVVNALLEKHGGIVGLKKPWYSKGEKVLK